MNAKSKAHYIEVWKSHINELTHVLAESTIPYSEWDVILLPLRKSVVAAAEKLEAEGLWDAVYVSEAVEGYYLGIVRTKMKPFRHYTDLGSKPKGNRGLANDWFEIGGKFYNVHPYRVDFLGYPVRWIESTDPRGDAGHYRTAQ